MQSIRLIPWPETTWSAAGRIASRAPVPLSESGRNQAQTWGDELAAIGLAILYSSDERPSVEAACIIAERCRIQRKTLPGLAEVDAGLWDGLTQEELEHRFPKAYKKWCSDPCGICPPEGEDIDDAYQRLQGAIDIVRNKHNEGDIAVVLGPLAFALVRCILEAVEPAQVRTLMHDKPLRYPLEEPSGG